MAASDEAPAVVRDCWAKQRAAVQAEMEREMELVGSIIRHCLG